jgi:hypothetical protein
MWSLNLRWAFKFKLICSSLKTPVGRNLCAQPTSRPNSLFLPPRSTTHAAHEQPQPSPVHRSPPRSALHLPPGRLTSGPRCQLSPFSFLLLPSRQEAPLRSAHCYASLRPAVLRPAAARLCSNPVAARPLRDKEPNRRAPAFPFAALPFPFFSPAVAPLARVTRQPCAPPRSATTRRNRPGRSRSRTLAPHINPRPLHLKP